MVLCISISSYRDLGKCCQKVFWNQEYLNKGTYDDCQRKYIIVREVCTAHSILSCQNIQQHAQMKQISCTGDKTIAKIQATMLYRYHTKTNSRITDLP